MTPHTPGPFHADGPIICGNGTEIDVDGFSIAHCLDINSNGRFSRFITKEEREANIRLLVAAPRMIDFILERSMEDHLLSCPKRRDNYSFCNCYVEKAQEILKVAKGQAS